jgi:hypothetical protein
MFGFMGVFGVEIACKLNDHTRSDISAWSRLGVNVVIRDNQSAL